MPKGHLSPQQLQMNMMPFTSTMSGSIPGSSNECAPKAPKDQPLFTAKQVILLCERLWKEREEKLKEEYDQVLHERLSGEDLIDIFLNVSFQHFQLLGSFDLQAVVITLPVCWQQLGVIALVKKARFLDVCHTLCSSCFNIPSMI